MTGPVIKVGKGRSEVTITGALAADLDRELRTALGGPVVAEIEAEADQILAGVRKRWPVKSGRSRDSWRRSLRVQPGEFKVEAVVWSPLRYVRFIKSTRVATRDKATRLRSPLVTEVRTPAREAQKRLKKSLVEVLARHLDEVGDG